MRDLKHDHRTNVGDRERRSSMIVGLVPLCVGLVQVLRRGRVGWDTLVLGSVGGELIRRGYTGRSLLYRALGINRREQQITERTQAPSEQRDIVDEASWESFPASDAPAHSSNN